MAMKQVNLRTGDTWNKITKASKVCLHRWTHEGRHSKAAHLRDWCQGI